MDFRMLGPLEVRDGGRSLALGGAKQRTLLAALLLHSNQVVSSDRLAHMVWGDDQPGTARNVIQVYVSQLRKILSTGPPDHLPKVTTRSPGYLLEIQSASFDVARFAKLADDGHDALTSGRAAEALSLLDAAASEFRGDPLAEFSFDAFAQEEIQRLTEKRLVLSEDLFDARLALGQSPSSFIPHIESLIGQHPYRERLRGQLMVALYRAGRQADALATYRATSDVLADELGIDPSPQLQELQAAILRQDESLAAPEVSLESTTADVALLDSSDDERVMVTVLAVAPGNSSTKQWRSDLALLENVGATILRADSEQAVALIGFPRVVEDHAERAALTALAWASYGAATAVATAKLATALLDNADVGLALAVDATTLADTPGVVRVNTATAQRLRTQFSISGADGSWTLQDSMDRPDEVPTTPLVGRGRELDRLRRLCDDLTAGRGQVLLVEGGTGLGKTRMLAELSTIISSEARWLAASCSPHDLAASEPLLSRAASGSGIAGKSALDVVTKLAATSPVVVALDDIQHIDANDAAEVESMLTLVEQIPLCVALTLGEGDRNEWAGLVGAVSTRMRSRLTHLQLDPLSEGETGELADALSPTGAIEPDARADLITRCAGNPLFVEQLVQSLVEDDTSSTKQGWTLALTTVGALLPPLLEDVLAVRMQKLSQEARQLAQAAAVLDGGPLPQLTATAGLDAAAVPLASLVQAEILLPQGRFPEVSYRFHHRLLQEAALSTLTPSRAKELYARAADVVEAQSDDLERIAFLRYRAHQWEEATNLLDVALKGRGPDDPRAQSLRVLSDRARSHLA